MSDLNSLNFLWLLICSFLVMSMQIGFCMLESGLVRSKNVINVAFKNMMDFVTACLVFWAIGFGVMYGASVSGLFGSSHFFVQHGQIDGAFLIFQMMFCGTAATIIGGALAERARFSVFIMISALIAAVVYPIAGHWAWAGANDGESLGWLGQKGFVDFAGSMVVHGVGGWFALAAVIVIGARIGRFDPTKPPIRGGNYPVATGGVLVLWFGWFGFNGGSGLILDSSVSKVLLNTSLAAATGGMALVCMAWLRDRRPDISASLNGVLAGLVGVTAGCHLYSTVDAIAVGVISAAVCAFSTRALEKAKIDDVLGAFPVHGAVGFIGVLLVAVLGDPSGFPQGHGMVQQLGVQLMGASAIALWSFGVGLVGLSVLSKFMALRVTAEQEIQGLNVSEHGASTDLVDLLADMHVKGENGDFKGAVQVDPHNEVGQIAIEYNRVLERVRREIETREEAWLQLKEASHFQFIFDNTHEGIIQLSLQGEILEANPAAALLLGYSDKEQLIGKAGQWLQKSVFNETDSLTKMIGELETTGSVIDQEIDFSRFNDGSEANISASIRLVEGNDDVGACYLLSVVDISDRRNNERLQMEIDAAESASEAKSLFLANMSHEIRTPLNGVTGMIELLSRTKLTEQQSRYTEIAGTSAQSLLSVINNILDMSKIEAGKLELEYEEFDLQETLGDVADMFAPQAASKDLEIVNVLSADIPRRVIGDSERFRQVLVNLLNNAIKFTESGSISLSSSVHRALEGAAHLQFEVKDTGCGIPETALNSLFDAFTQADVSTTREYGGTGLGLTICSQLVGLMKGTIRVESEVGKGTTFTIDLVLPVGNCASDAMTGCLNEAHAGKRVLAVDDHPANLTVVCDLLRPYDIEVETAEDGPSALQVLKHSLANDQAFDLMLLDFQMPGMDGAELARAIRGISKYDDTKIVMLTSVDQAIPLRERKELGINSSITKPLRASRFFEAVNTVLETVVEPKKVIKQTGIVKTKSQTPKPATEPSADSELVLGCVLLVEDNMVNQMVAEGLLEAMGYQVTIASDGKEALNCLENQTFDAVLMDCQMPVMDGFEATRQWRQFEKVNGLSRLPIIALTANAVKGDRERCIESGMDEYVTKPIDTAHLTAILADQINSKAA